MRTEKRDIYICEHCGGEYNSEESCRAHERQCYLREEAVRVVLMHTRDDKFIFSAGILKSCHLEVTQVYEEVYGYDVDCDRFEIVSKDTSEEHIAELKDNLVKRATELIKENRERYDQYYGGLLKELEQVKEGEK